MGPHGPASGIRVNLNNGRGNSLRFLRRGPGPSLTPARENRDARSGGCGFESAILYQGDDPANKAPPPPDLASLRQREADPDQSRFNRGSCLGREPRPWRTLDNKVFRQPGSKRVALR